MLDNSEDIVQGNPTHILLAWAHDSTETEPKGREQLGEHPSCRTQHYTEPQMHHAYTTLHGGRCGCFPGLAHFGQEACPWRAGFTEDCLTAVSIIANS